MRVHEEFMAEFHKGEDRAMELVANFNREKLIMRAERILRKRSTAEMVVEEVLMLMKGHRKKFRSPKSIVSWLELTTDIMATYVSHKREDRKEYDDFRKD